MSLFRKFQNSFSKEKLERDAADELAYHLELRTRENQARGYSEQEARERARRQLGNLTLMREKTNDADLLTWLESWGREFRFALRILRKAPLFTAMTILSLGLGIGATTMVFTVAKQVVLDYLPVAQPDRLVILHNQGVEEGHTNTSGIKSSFSYPLYRDLNAATSGIFKGILGRFAVSVTLSRSEGSEVVRCELVSGNYFDVLGAKAWRGRLLQASDDLRPGAHPVAVLSYGYWQRNFGSDGRVVGTTIRLNNHPYTVVGVAPQNFYGLDLASAPAVFVPMMMKAQMTPTWNGLENRLDHWCNLMARLRDGVSLEKAQAALNVLYGPLRKQDLTVKPFPPAFVREFAKNHVDLESGGKGYSDVRETLRSPLQFLTGMVAILLLITVVNVANLLIARSAGKQREVAIRLSVGAGKLALMRQLLVESLTLAGLGGLLGILLTYLATPVLLRFLSSDLSDSSIRAVPDWRVLLFAVVVSLGAGLAFGLLPAWNAARTDVAAALKTEGASGHTGERYLLRRVLVGGQVAFSLVLLSGALLFARSLHNLQTLNPGFVTSHLMSFKVDPAGAGYSQLRIRSFGQEIRKKLGAQGDVAGVGLATVPLLEDTDRGSDVKLAGESPTSHNGEEARVNQISPGLLSTLKVPLLSGRFLADSDLMPNTKVALVNATFVKHFLGDRNALGVRFGFGSGKVAADTTIVGVVADSEHSSLRAKIGPFVYLPYTGGDELSTLTFYLRIRGSEDTAAREIRSIVRKYDPHLPVYDLRSMQAAINEQLFAERGLGLLSILFSTLAVLLALVGLYGVMAYAVTRRRREFGVRMAIGATPRRILQMMLREAALVGIAGIVVALPVVVGAGQLIRSSLYGVSASSPLLISVAALFLFSALLLAALLPAARASRTDPHAALRAD